MRLSRDGLLGLVCLGSSGILFVVSLSLPHLPIVPVGPGVYPRIVLGFLALVSLALVVQDWRTQSAASPREEEDGGRASPQTADYRLVAVSFAIVGAYILILPYAGFRISTAAFVAVLQVALERPATPVAWTRVVLVALATAALSYLVFERYLSVLLPRGTLTGW